MKKIIAMVISCVFSYAIVTASYGETCPAGKYCGDEKSFADFKSKYNKDWPTPDKIGYYDPDGKEPDVIRYAHWLPEPQNRKGVVVHFNGRTEFIEKNIYTYKNLLDRGYEVWTFDWRGQGFSKREEEIIEKQKHNIKTFDSYLNDVVYFIDNIAKIKDAKGKKILLAHSMGGQIALRYLLDKKNQNIFDYAVLSSPLLRVPGDAVYVRLFNPIKIGLGFGNSCVIEKKDIWVSYFKDHNSCELIGKANANALDRDTNTPWYSTDLNKDADIDCLIESSKDANNKGNEDKPDLRLGCPTSNWLHAAFESTDIVMAKAKELKTPTLIVRALPDHAVDNTGQTDFCILTANCTIISIGIVDGVQTGHELLIEQEPIRKIFFELFDGFVGISPVTGEGS